MEKRRSERKDVQIDVKISLGDESCAGFIDNVSPEGLAVSIITAPGKSISCFVKGTILGLTFQAANQEIALQCEIKWVNKTAERHVGLIYIMGAEIIDPPAEYKEFLTTL